MEVSADSPATGPAPAPDATAHYGPAADQVYDVRHPTATALQRTALIVHGGFWRPSYDRAHAAEQSAAFAAAGYHVATLEYRRTPGEWPQMSADILDGLMAVRANPNLPESVALVGHSAGGHPGHLGGLPG